MKRIYTISLLLICSLAIAQTPRECVTLSIQNEIGVREATGRNDGTDVEKYLASVHLGAGYAWCAAFVNWNLEQCHGAKYNKSGWSPAWFPESRVIYTRDGIISAIPRAGDVFGIYFPSKQRIAHVGFIMVWSGDKVTTIEGNTNTAGSREGDGVYRKYRLRSQIYKVANWID